MDSQAFDHQEMRWRMSRIRQWMGGNGWDALVVENQANVRYLSGFRGEPATLWITADEALLMTSYRSERWAREQSQTFNVICEPDPISMLADKLRSQRSRIATDPQITHARLSELRESWSDHVVEPASGIQEMRRIKSEAEINRLDYSQRINEQIFERVLDQIRPGMTERSAQGIILQEMAAMEEVEGPSFTPIIAAGPNAWEIHHLPDDTELKTGDMVIIDHGVMVGGYASDMTRTICLGKATDRMKEIHSKVREAQLAALSVIADGVSAVDADSAAREIIEAAGHGRGYTHGLGHGIGMETHDAGLRMSKVSGDLKLQSGMVVTVEPGIYLENEFGVRTEDVVVVKEGGSTNLTNMPHELIELVG